MGERGSSHNGSDLGNMVDLVPCLQFDPAAGGNQTPVAGSGDRRVSELSPRKYLSSILNHAGADLNSLSSTA